MLRRYDVGVYTHDVNPLNQKVLCNFHFQLSHWGLHTVCKSCKPADTLQLLLTAMTLRRWGLHTVCRSSKPEGALQLLLTAMTLRRWGLHTECKSDTHFATEDTLQLLLAAMTL